MYRAPSPYGQPPPRAASPYGQPPPRAASPYGQPPPRAASPYGQPPPRAPSPYGQPPPRAPSPYGQRPPRAPSPYGQPPPRAPSPYGQAPPSVYSPQPTAQAYSPQPAQPQPPASGDIVPGSVTYTTSTGPDGRLLYHPFKAVAASYQTPNGIVSGIQWVPAEATHILPQGAQPASADFAWNRGNKDKDKLKEWQHEEDKRRKREEKEAAKRLRQQQELRNEEKAREHERERRKSFTSSGPQPDSGDFFGYGGYSRERKPSNAGYEALDRQFNNMDLNHERKASGTGRPRKYSTSAGEERPGPYGSAYGSASPYGSPYAPPAAPPYATSGGGRYSPNPSGNPDLPFVPPGGKYSPNPSRAADLPPTGNPSYPGSAYSSSARSTTPYGAPVGGQPQVYPRGHILEGQPIPPRSRASSPMQGPPGAAPYGQPYTDLNRPPPSPRMGGASPHIPGGPLPEAAQQLLPPEAFSRPVNPGLTYSPFNTTKIQAMEEFLLAPNPPRMPMVLKSHDVYPEDWLRLMNDLRLAWSGRLPVPTDNRSGQPPRRTTLVADLVDLWNTSFFFARGVEVILYKGRERRSGPRAGTIDNGLPLDDDSDKSESEEEDEDDESDLEEYLMRNAAAYGRQPDFDPVIIARRKREAKEEKRRTRKEKEAKRKAKAKEKEKIYALYITYAPPSGSAHTAHTAHPAGGMPGGYPVAQAAGYVPTATATPSVGGYGRQYGY